jgi:hypothetical protein
MRQSAITYFEWGLGARRRDDESNQPQAAIVLRVFGDDSMDETKERVCAVVGVIGTEAAWKELKGKWLARTGGIPFHANDCDSDYGDYVNTPHAENKALYRDLAIILADSHVGGYGHAIDLMAHRRVFPGTLDIAYYRAFLGVIEEMKNVARNNEEIAELTFDMRLESEYNAGLLYGHARENEPEWTLFLAGKISFAFSRDEPGIQIADLLAREAMKALDNQVGPVKRKIRKSWAVLRETKRFEVEAYSDDWFNDLKKHYAELRKKVGFRQEDYVNWLRERNRQPNTTNLIHFLDWIAKRDKDERQS